jgi:hypothetical protein
MNNMGNTAAHAMFKESVIRLASHEGVTQSRKR